MYNYEATIRRWVDGDTVDVDIDLGFGLIYSNQRLRLYGIDAYESRTRDLDEKKKGKYGRILAEVFIETSDNEWKCINSLLTEEGHATRYPE